MNLLSPRERLEHMAQMYDSYGYGEGLDSDMSNYGYGLKKRRSGSKKSKKGSGKLMKGSKILKGILKRGSKKARGGVSVGGVRKRKLTEYNKFFKQMRLQGYSAAEVGKEWRKIKGTSKVSKKKVSGSKKAKKGGNIKSMFNEYEKILSRLRK